MSVTILDFHDNLYNPKHKLYFDKDKRSKYLEAIKATLLEESIIATTKQISDKLVNLKTCYGAQKRQIECSKGGFPLVLFASGTGKEIINKRDWLFS